MRHPVLHCHEPVPLSQPVEDDIEAVGISVQEVNAILAIGWGKTRLRVEHLGESRVGTRSESRPASFVLSPEKAMN